MLTTVKSFYLLMNPLQRKEFMAGDTRMGVAMQNTTPPGLIGKGSRSISISNVKLT